MKKTIVVVALAASFGAYAATKPMPSPAATPAAQTPRAAMATTARAGDSVALGMLAAINQHEIDAAKQAKAKKVSAPVLAYAAKMEKEHGENLAKTKTLGTLSNDAQVQAQKVEGKQHLAELGKKSGKDYESAYVDAMVKGHSDVLAKIDGTLLPMATSAAVKKHLTETRGHVAMHLDEAKALQAAR